MYSPLLAVILLVSCSWILVLHSQPFFLWTVRSACRKKRLAMRDQPDLSSAQDASGYARLQPVLHGFLLSETITLVISPLAATMAR